jgi:hypothetical protein
LNEFTALKKMVAPGQHRPGVAWGVGGVMQISLTRSCDKACFGCTQGSNLRGKPMTMSVEQFKVALDSLEGYPYVIGIFGGNAALLKNFPEYCRVLQESWVPFKQRGLWCNKPFGHGKLMRETFNPRVSNINVHLDDEAKAEFERDWPELIGLEGNFKGFDSDSRHSPVYVAMKDVIPDESERWNLISNCDINKYWSAYIGTFRGELRAWFCEIAGAMSRLHQDEPDYPDTGMVVEPGWWKRPMIDFAHQVRHACHSCGIPLKGYGSLAVNGEFEQVSKTHAAVYLPKIKGREVRVVEKLEEVNAHQLNRATDYIQNSGV